MNRSALATAFIMTLAAPAWAQTAASPSTAQTGQRDRMKDCSAQAKTQGLKGTDRKSFLSSCLSGTAAAPAAPTASSPTNRATSTPKPTSPTAARTSPGTPPTAGAAAVFPAAVLPKYSSESAGKARMHTCLDQYNANKATNANGGLNWIAKGGGYYSECNKRLKG